MPLGHNFERISSDDDPERCQGVIPGRGQCINRRLSGSNFCAAHGGNVGNEMQKAASLRRYRLAKWQSRVDELATDSGIKDLKDEVAILRMMLEEQLTACKTSMDLMLNSGRISDMVMKIDKVVGSCQRLDKELGGLIDKSTAMRLGQEIVRIIGEQIPEAVAAIVEKTGIDTDIVEKVLNEELIDACTRRIAAAIEHTRSELKDKDA